MFSFVRACVSVCVLSGTVSCFRTLGFSDVTQHSALNSGNIVHLVPLTLVCNLPNLRNKCQHKQWARTQQVRMRDTGVRKVTGARTPLRKDALVSSNDTHLVWGGGGLHKPADIKHLLWWVTPPQEGTTISGRKRSFVWIKRLQDVATPQTRTDVWQTDQSKDRQL